MTTIKLSDQVGLEIEVKLDKDSALAKYVKDPKSMKLSELKFGGLKDITLDRVQAKSFQSGITFEQPVDVGAGDVELKIGAGVSGAVKLYSQKDKQLFDPELFNDPVSINTGQYYVGVGLTAKLSAELGAKSGDLSFGFSAGTNVAFTTFRLFEKQNNGQFPLAADALSDTFSGFVIPGDLEDLQGMPTGTVAAVEGGGSLKFSGSIDLLSVVNPLAVVDLPDPTGGDLKITEGTSIKVAASFELTGQYQIRVQKTGAGRVRLGYYKKRGSEFNFKVTGTTGLSAGVGKTDLIAALLKAISSDPEADKAVLTAGGLNEDQIETINKVIEAAVSRKLEIALGYEFDALETSDAAFLYEINLAALDESGRRAVHLALDGDLSGLPADAGALPPGVGFIRSIFTEVQKKKHTFKVNLLGIYNFASVSTLTLKGTVMFEQATGELVITDKATASRIAASTLNFAADSQKLRKVIAENVIVTAVYHLSGLAPHKADLRISHTYFELHSKTDRTRLKNNLDVFEALGLLTATEAKKTLSSITKPGRSTLYVETGYDDASVGVLFLKNGAARPQEDYEAAGHAALKLLVQKGDEDEARRRLATDPALWQEMKEQGQANFKNIQKLKDLKAPMLGVVIGDYSDIIWWAESMHGLGEQLAELKKFLAANPSADPENNTFKSLRKELAKRLKDVASKTRADFGDPWGLVSMDQASGGRATVHALLTANKLIIDRTRNS